MTNDKQMIEFRADARLLGDYDLVVVGSGSAGICAALAAARSGTRVALIEAFPNIGGTSASGLPLLTTNDYRGRQLSKGILEEIMEELRKEGAFEGDLASGFYFCYDVDKYRLVVTRLLIAAGVRILTFTRIVGIKRVGAQIAQVFVHQKEGFGAISSKVFIDCSGDADLAHLAGEPMQANEIDGKPQPPTLLFFVGNVVSAEIDWPTIQHQWDELRSLEHWINPRVGFALSPPFSYPGKSGFHGMNVTRSLGVDATRTEDLVRMEIEQREQVDEFFYKFLRRYVPAFRTAYLAGTHFISGIRESRRIKGAFTLSADSLRLKEEFPDAVAWSSYPIDRHSPVQGSTDWREAEAKQEGYYSVPFRIMVPAGTTNLLVSGRCVSADENAFSAVRVMGTTMALGEAAGIAAAIMAVRTLPAAAVPIAEVRETLRARGAFLPPMR
jgi:hypothetical protein